MTSILRSFKSPVFYIDGSRTSVPNGEESFCVDPFVFMKPTPSRASLLNFYRAPPGTL
jgi:hypothetical protein